MCILVRMKRLPIIHSEHRSAVSSALGVSSAAISNWLSRGVPVEHCATIERVTNGEITRQALRPDDWHVIWPELAQPNAED